jgi:hypothetical protein
VQPGVRDSFFTTGGWPSIHVLGSGMEKRSRLLAVAALLGTSACAGEGPLAPQVSPAPESLRVAADMAFTPSGRAPVVRLWCAGSISAQDDPLYVVDGRVLADGDLGNVDPASITAIEVIKAAAAVARFGPRAETGAVLITTRAAQSPSPT